MRRTAVVFLVSVIQITWAQEPPPRLTQDDFIDASVELERLGSIDGVWVGDLKTRFDPVGANREWPDGFPIRIEIQGDAVGLWNIEEGGVLEPFPGDAVLIFAVDGTALIDYVAGNETFNEIWSISLNHVDPDVMKGFVSRTVHNFAVKKDSPWRVFPVYSVMNLKRER